MLLTETKVIAIGSAKVVQLTINVIALRGSYVKNEITIMSIFDIRFDSHCANYFPRI